MPTSRRPGQNIRLFLSWLRVGWGAHCAFATAACDDAGCSERRGDFLLAQAVARPASLPHARVSLPRAMAQVVRPQAAPVAHRRVDMCPWQPCAEWVRLRSSVSAAQVPRATRWWRRGARHGHGAGGGAVAVHRGASRRPKRPPQRGLWHRAAARRYGSGCVGRGGGRCIRRARMHHAYVIHGGNIIVQNPSQPFPAGDAAQAVSWEEHEAEDPGQAQSEHSATQKLQRQVSSRRFRSMINRRVLGPPAVARQLRSLRLVPLTWFLGEAGGDSQPVHSAQERVGEAVRFLRVRKDGARPQGAAYHRDQSPLAGSTTG